MEPRRGRCRLLTRRAFLEKFVFQVCFELKACSLVVEEAVEV